MVVLEGLAPIFSIKHRHDLALAAAIASDADPLIVRESVLEVAKLGVQSLLGSDDVRPSSTDDLRYHGKSIGPQIRWVGVSVSDVEGHYGERRVSSLNRRRIGSARGTAGRNGRHARTQDEAIPLANELHALRLSQL